MYPWINVAEHYTNINYVVLIDWLPIIGRSSLMGRSRHCMWRPAQLRPMAGAYDLWTRIGLYYDKGLRFLRSHPRDHPIKSCMASSELVQVHILWIGVTEWRVYALARGHGSSAAGTNEEGSHQGSPGLSEWSVCQLHHTVHQKVKLSIRRLSLGSSLQILCFISLCCQEF